MKTCRKCEQVLPLSAFNKDKRRGHAARCKECRKIEVQVWRDANRDHVNKSERDRYATSPKKWAGHLRRAYGITPEQYAEMLAQQRGACAICEGVFAATLAVDHDHLTGKVRGLLCGACNRMLGSARDRPETLCRAAAYLIDAAVNE